MIKRRSRWEPPHGRRNRRKERESTSATLRTREGGQKIDLRKKREMPKIQITDQGRAEGGDGVRKRTVCWLSLSTFHPRHRRRAENGGLRTGLSLGRVGWNRDGVGQKQTGKDRCSEWIYPPGQTGLILRKTSS